MQSILLLMTRVVLLLSTFSSIRQNAAGAFFGGFVGGGPHCHHNHHRPYRKAADALTSVFSSPTRNSAPEMAVPPHQPVSRSDGDNNDDDDELMDDTTLLETITRTQLVELCESCQLPVAESASKQVLLQQLRQHAAMQAAAAQERLERRRRRVEEGAGWAEDDDFSSKERYELVEDNYNYNQNDKHLWDDDEAVFFYAAPDTKTNSESSDQQSKRQKSTDTSHTTKQKQPTRILDRSTVTAPPLPPDTPVNEDGTRSVTIYSTTEQNDLTAVASSQPGANQHFDPLSSSAVNTPQPWDLERQKTSSTSERALEQARVQILELVSNLLTLSGAPGFITGMDDDDDDGTAITTPVYSSKSRQPFVGFNPATVPTDWLTQASAALKAGRGQILQEVLREFELRAVGLDGAMGDARDRGGGHYAEVNKVRAFLEGYRRAQVRKVARETATLLLDKLCSEGLDGLDITLASMVRSNDDTASEAGVELNDSLLDFLNDAIRQQEKKVDQLVAKRLDGQSNGAAVVENRDDESDHDPMQQLWNVTMEDGQRVETLDPRNPVVQRVLQEEAAKADAMSLSPPTGPTIPETAPEQLLLLLTLLRERVKTEAAFGTDEKGRNLRLLAYCLRVSTNEDREQLILNAVGNSLDRLDSFAELTESSIEYGESTSYRLHPAKTQLLNVAQLKQILTLTRDLRQRQTFKASGLRP